MFCTFARLHFFLACDCPLNCEESKDFLDAGDGKRDLSAAQLHVLDIYQVNGIHSIGA